MSKQDVDQMKAELHIMREVFEELKRAKKKFPNQTLPWGGGPGRFWLITGPLGSAAQIQKAIVDAMLREGTASWFDVIAEELLEAGAEAGRSKHPGDEPAQAHGRLRSELIQVAAMCLRAIEDLDRQKADLDAARNYQVGADGYVRPAPPQGGVSDADEFPLLPPGGRHSGNCSCNACDAPYVSREAEILMEADGEVPPNAGSVS